MYDLTRKMQEPIAPNSKVLFSKFNGGKIETHEGFYVKTEKDFVYVNFEEKTYAFRRAPGTKCGWGIKDARFWRLTQEYRDLLCLRDVPSRRKLY